MSEKSIIVLIYYRHELVDDNEFFKKDCGPWDWFAVVRFIKF